MAEVPEGYEGAVGEAALAGSAFAETAFEVPPDPGVVRTLQRVESAKDRKARERLEREVEADRVAAEKQKARDARRAADQEKQRRSRRKKRSGSSSSKSESDSDTSSKSDSSRAIVM